VVCPNCRQRFGRERGILSLIPRKRRAELEALSIGYRLARLDEGWRPMTSRQLLALPHGSPKGYPPLYWKVRRQTFRAFSEFLQREGPVPDDGPAADIGAGTGWLAHRLAQRGYQTIALDASLDVDFGLGASAAYRSSFRGSFMPIQGDLDALPLQQALFGLVIFNASLHYAQDLAGTLHRAARALSPRGCLVVLDTPVAQRPHRGCEIGERHLGRRELGRSLSAAGLLSRHVRVRRGLRWHVYQLRAAARGNDRFFFPMVIASRHYKNDETA
jgi:SAM-dependent methyltransferase